MKIAIEQRLIMFFFATIMALAVFASLQIDAGGSIKHIAADPAIPVCPNPFDEEQTAVCQAALLPPKTRVPVPEASFERSEPPDHKMLPQPPGADHSKRKE